MTRRELLYRLADRSQRLHLRRDVQCPVRVAPRVERYDADGIPGDEVAIAFDVVEHEGEDSIQAIEEFRALALVERKDHLAIGVRGEAPRKPFPKLAVVVDLAVDREDGAPIPIAQRLGSVQNIDDCEALMRQDGLVAREDARPVGAAVPL